MNSELAEWLTQIWDEDEAIALEASRKDGKPIVEGGEHWQWVCQHHDEVITPDPLTQDVLACPQDSWDIDLRSVEEYPTTSGVGNLPHFVVRYSTEVSPVVAQHIARHDPAAVLARIAPDRRILAEYVARDDDADLMLGPDCQRQREWSGLRLAVRILAERHAARPGYREEWRP